MRKYRGIIHFHSKYSYDSLLGIEEIVEFAKQNNLNFLCLTDHNTIEGAIELYNYVQKKKLDIEVIIGAEYKTSLGDIIALCIKEEITEMEFDAFVAEVRRQNGVLLLPHPYKGHRNIEYIASKVDLIEVFNSRVKDEDNHRALLLAR